MPQKFDISVWPIATPSANIVNTIIHHSGKYKVHFIYQISEVLFDMHKWLSAKETTCTIFQWGISLISHWWKLRENNPSLRASCPLHLYYCHSPAILFLAIMLHNVCFILHLSLHKQCQEKNTCTGKTAKIESQNTFVYERAERANDFWSF